MKRYLPYAPYAPLLALLLVALLGNVLARPVPPREPARIHGYWVLEGDLHVHSSLAGAVATPVDIPLLARRRALDFVAVTEHNAWLGGALARLFGLWFAPEVVVIPSEEITNRAYHLLAIGLSSRVDPRLPLSRIAAEVHAQGGLVIAAHPTRETWPLLLGLADAGALDGAELFHPTMLRHADISADYSVFREEAKQHSGHSLITIGTSDYHGGGELGYLRTVVLAESKTEEGILAALRAQRAVAVTPDGRMAGDEQTLQALQNAHYVPGTVTAMAPAPHGAAEHALGIAGVLVMILSLFRRRLLKAA